MSGDSSVGGTKAHITSEFAIAFQLSILTAITYGFFVAVAAGMAVIHDDECQVSELLHATPLRPGEYVWGKFAAVAASALLVLAVHLAAMIVCNHVLPAGAAREFRGPFHLASYLKPGAPVQRADRRVHGGRVVRPGRVDAAARARVLPAAGRLPRLRLLPLGVGAELARPAGRQGPDADRPGRVPLAE